jgi:formylglycine-generating enzyme required for sulfatase activity
MGSPDDDDMAQDNEKPQHPVTVSGFRMAVTPVTAELYHEIMPGEAPAEGREQTPAVNVSWFDAVAFCNRLSKREGYRRCYYRLFGRWFCYWRADGYRLPTEAEWEYACRAGTKTRYSFGDDPDGLDRYAWFRGQSTQEVAQKLPNPWGLYDMLGNVWEWCWDWYGDYTSEEEADPTGPKSGSYRVLRGGSFGLPPERLRSAYRVVVRPEDGDEFVGFRCVRVPQLID